MRKLWILLAASFLALAGCSKGGAPVTLEARYAAYYYDERTGCNFLYLATEQDFAPDEIPGEYKAVGPFVRCLLGSKTDIKGTYSIVDADNPKTGEALVYVHNCVKGAGWMTSGTVTVTGTGVTCTAQDGNHNIQLSFTGPLRKLDCINEISEEF